MNNWDLYNLTNYIINKEQTGNTFDSGEYVSVFNKNSYLYLGKLLGAPELYPQELPITQFGDGKTTSLIHSIEPLIVEERAINLTLGVGSIPTDCFYHQSTVYKYVVNSSCNPPAISDRSLELCNSSEFKTRKTSSLFKPSMLYPIMMLGDGDIYTLPKTLGQIYMTYVKKPTLIVISTTISGDGEEVYNASGSIESEWRDYDKYKIMSMILQDVGINLRAQDIYQYGVAKQQSV